MWNDGTRRLDSYNIKILLNKIHDNLSRRFAIWWTSFKLSLFAVKSVYVSFTTELTWNMIKLFRIFLKRLADGRSVKTARNTIAQICCYFHACSYFCVGLYNIFTSILFGTFQLYQPNCHVKLGAFSNYISLRIMFFLFVLFIV